MRFEADNHNDTYHTCAKLKGFLDSNFNQTLLTNYQIFTKLSQISQKS